MQLDAIIKDKGWFHLSALNFQYWQLGAVNYWDWVFPSSPFREMGEITSPNIEWKTFLAFELSQIMSPSAPDPVTVDKKMKHIWINLSQDLSLDVTTYTKSFKTGSGKLIFSKQPNDFYNIIFEYLKHFRYYKHFFNR